MKKSIYICLFAVLASCNELEPEDVHFDVSVESTTVKVGEPVVFNFEGNPNYITLYAGDQGHKYANRERTEVDASDIEKTAFSFTYLAKAVSSGHKDCFRAYLSADFPRLTMNAETDKEVIQNHAWIDITDECLKNIEDGSATAKNTGEIDLSAFYPNGFVFAFRFLGKKELDLQRTVVITELKVTNQLKNGSSSELLGSSINFIPFDTYPSNPDGDPYKKILSGAVPTGTWNLTSWSSNTIRMIGSTRKEPVRADNDDWLISNKIELRATCDPDKGEVIKDISRRVERYEYTYHSPGIYTVTILAGNVNIEGENKVIKELEITVEE